MSRKLLVVSLLLFCISYGCSKSGSSNSDSSGRLLGQGDGGEGMDQSNLTLSPEEGSPGFRVTASGSDLPEGICRVELFWETAEGPSLGVADVQEGSFSLVIEIPGEAKRGEHKIIAQGLVGDESCDTPSGDPIETIFTITVNQPPTGPFDFSIFLKNRIITPEDVVDEEFLEEIRGSERGITHALVQLKSLPRRSRRELVDGVLRNVPANDLEALRENGIHLLEYLNAPSGSGTAYLAALFNTIDVTSPIFNELIRAIVKLEPSDKLEAGLLSDPSGTEALKVLVLFFSDVTAPQASLLFEGLGMDAVPYAPPRLWRTSATPEEIQALAEKDPVEWIEAGPLPFLPLLSDVRSASKVNAIQEFDLETGRYGGLSGAGVQIGILDSGIDSSHGDFSGRIIRMDPPLDDHGTAVAGVAAGSGIQSDQENGAGEPNGGAPFQWRGMAPEAQIAAYEKASGSVENYNDAINGFGVDVTNHSYVLHVQGLYGADVASVDAIVRGDLEGIPARPAIWAAGNNANLKPGDCGEAVEFPQYPLGCPEAFQVGYFSVLSPAKNALSVASVEKESLAHSPFSSLGPTMDGRLKPEISAVGSAIIVPGGSLDASGNPTAGNGYRSLEGTSMAAAAVTGIVSLLLEKYSQTFEVSLDEAPPLPSTIKAILIHTATDLAGADPTENADTGDQVIYGVGPDLATGYGLVSAEAAIDLVEEGRFLENELTIAEPTDEFLLAVIPGQKDLKVTLAWDDAAGSVLGNETSPKLVNDLDLVLVDPSGTPHHPQIFPLLTPRDCDEDPTNGIQVGDCPGLDPEDQSFSGPVMEGVDRRNNVEQVLVHDDRGLQPGSWKVRVSALHDDGISVQLPLGGSQGYSLVGISNQRADVSITKADQPDPAIAGESLFYTIQVSNAGPDLATTVTVVDTLPAGVSYVTDTAGCEEGPPGTLTCKLGDLEASETREIVIKVLVNSNLVAESGQPISITNRVTVFGGVPDDDMANNRAESSTIVMDRADLRVTKNCTPNRPLLAGKTGTCTIFVDNLGPSTARNVQLLDTILSDGLYTISSVESSQGDCEEPVRGTIRCHLGDIPAASAEEVGRATVTIEITATETMDIDDLASVTSDTPDPDPTNNQSEDSLLVDAVADLSLDMAVSPEPVTAGTSLTYTLTATNNGPSEAVNVEVRDEIPPGLVVESIQASDQGACTFGVPGDPSHPAICFFGSLAPQESRTLTIEATVLPWTTGVLHNNARVSSETLDKNNSNDLASTSVTIETEADLQIFKTDLPDPVVAGRQLAYEISIVNEGPSTARNIRLRDILPAGLSFLSSKILGGEGSCMLLEGPPKTISCQLNDLDPGEEVSVLVKTQVHPSVHEGTILTCTANVSSSTPDGDESNNTVTESTSVYTEADLKITLTSKNDTGNPSNTFVHTVTVVNQGPSDALDVRIVDRLPLSPDTKKVVYIFDNGGCSLNASTNVLTCEVERLPAGGEIRFDIHFQVKGSVGLITNHAGVVSATPDPELLNNITQRDVLVKGGVARPSSKN